MSQIPLSVTPIRVGFPHVHATASSLVVWARTPYEGSDDRPIRLLRLTAGDTMTLFSGVLPLSRTGLYPDCGMALTRPTLFAAQIRWDRRGDRIAIVTSAHYVVDIHGPDGSRRTFRRAIEPELVNRAEALDSLRRRPFGGPFAPCGTSAEQRLEKHGFAPEHQLIHALAVADDGTLWVQRRSQTDGLPGPIDLFTRGGDYRGSLAPGAPMPLAFLPNDRTAFAERVENDIERLVVARIRRQ